MATGSEVSIGLEAAGKLRSQGIKTRVVSLPCWFVFDQQPQEYRLSVLRSGAPILSLEALSVRGYQYLTYRTTDEDAHRPLVGQNTATSNMVCLPGVHPALTKRCMRSMASLATVRTLPGHRPALGRISHLPRYRSCWKESRRLLQGKRWQSRVSFGQGSLSFCSGLLRNSKKEKVEKVEILLYV